MTKTRSARESRRPALVRGGVLTSSANPSPFEEVVKLIEAHPSKAGDRRSSRNTHLVSQPQGSDLLLLGHLVDSISWDLEDGRRLLRCEDRPVREFVTPHPRCTFHTHGDGKDLFRWTKAYVAGSVAFGDTGECAEGVAVSVKLNGTTVAEDTANNYGDFRIDKLEPGGYVVALSASGYRQVETAVTVDANSTSLPPLFLQSA